MVLKCLLQRGSIVLLLLKLRISVIVLAYLFMVVMLSAPPITHFISIVSHYGTTPASICSRAPEVLLLCYCKEKLNTN